MNFYRRNRGAVSVFLVLVLVPCIVISSIFVDLSRVYLSQASANSAADLALNTLLTNYDKELSEYYGLIGSCQTVEQFYTVSAEFFLRTLKSQDLSDDEILLLSGVYADATNDDTIYDLLQVECSDATVSAVTGANLGQPAFLKDSIVEFMKYRAPIEMAATLIGRIRSGAGGVDEFLDAEENKPLTDAKEAFLEAEGELLKAAIYTYLAIKDYDTKFRENPKMDVKQMLTDEGTIAGYREAYKLIHEISVNNLLNTGSLTQVYSRPTYDMISYRSKYDGDKVASICSSSEEAEDGTITYYINKADFDTIMGAATRALQDLQTAISEYSDVTGDLMSNSPSSDMGVHPIQWWVDMHNAVYQKSQYSTESVHQNLVSKANAVMNSYAKLWAIKRYCEAEPTPSPKPAGYQSMPSDWNTQCGNKETELYQMWSKYLSSSPTVTGGFVSAANELHNVSKEYINHVKPTSLEPGMTVQVNGLKYDVSSAIVVISNDLTKKYNTYKKLVELLDIAIDGSKEEDGKVKSLDALLNLANTYSTTFSTYSTEANNANTAGTELGKQEKKEVDEKQLQQEINKASVTELKNRLVNIRDQYKTLMQEIETFTYGGISVKDIKSFTAFKNTALTVVKDGDIPRSHASVDRYSDSVLVQLLKPDDGKEVKLTNTSNTDYQPDLDVDTPKLYAYMKEEFKDVDIKKMEEDEKEEESVESEQAAFEEEEKKNAAKYHGNEGATMTKTYGWTNTFNATGILTSVISLVQDIVDGNFDGIRDDMYVTTYVMEMFSHAAYDREAMYQMLTAEQRKDMVPSTADSYFKDTCGVYGTSETDREKWLSSDVRDSYNKSLTNQMINGANNHIYLAEVEYLLYGKTTPQENLNTSYGNIYALRLILNTISGYQHFWSYSTTTGNLINTLAISLSGATAGIVPAAVFKIVMIPILAALESCKDMSRLFAGMPVELYKTKPDDWWVSLELSGKPTGLSDFFTKLKNSFISDKGKNQDDGFFYSDYLTLFVYCALTDSKTEADTYKRLAELIDANMAKVRPKKAGEPGFTLMKTQMYFRLTAKVRVKPLMIAIPYMDAYGNSMETATDWCTYTVDMVRGYS